MDVREIFFQKYQRCIERKADKKNDGRLVLMFHQVTDQEENWYNIRYAMTLKAFKDVIAWCVCNNYEFVTPKDILECDGRKKILLTFDDAFRETYSEVFPFLQEEGYPFVVFPTIELLKKKDYITLEMLREMNEYTGCFIGTHTLSHCFLRKESAIRRREEIIEPKKILENYLGKTIEYMAYPYGTCYAVSKEDIKIARDNYQCAFSTLQTCVTGDADRYFIPRINMNESSWKDTLEYYKK